MGGNLTSPGCTSIKTDWGEIYTLLLILRFTEEMDKTKAQWNISDKS